MRIQTKPFSFSAAWNKWITKNDPGIGTKIPLQILKLSSGSHIQLFVCIVVASLCLNPFTNIYIVFAWNLLRRLLFKKKKHRKLQPRHWKFWVFWRIFRKGGGKEFTTSNAENNRVLLLRFKHSLQKSADFLRIARKWKQSFVCYRD